MHVVPIVVDEGGLQVGRINMSPRQGLHNAANVLIIYQRLHNKIAVILGLISS